MILKNLCVVATLLLSACAMQNPSFVHHDKMRVMSEPVRASFAANALSQAQLQQVAEDIKHRAEHDVTVLVLHAPGQAPQVAQAQGNSVRQFLLNAGVQQNIHVQLQPESGRLTNEISILYDGLRAASSCEQSMQNADAGLYDHGSDSDYRFGCAHDQMLALQIARPEDLLGNDTTTRAESQRTAKSIDNFRAGENATPANTQSLTASTVYQQ